MRKDIRDVKLSRLEVTLNVPEVFSRILWNLTLASAFGALSATAQDSGPSVQVLEAYAAPTATNQTCAEVYARFVNVEVTDQLIGADSSVSRRVHFVGADGTVRPFKDFEFHEDVEIGFREEAPHLQLVKLKHPLVRGQTFVVILHFKESGSLALNVTVR